VISSQRVGVAGKVGVALTSTPAPSGGLYEWTAGKLELVSVAPADLGHAQSVTNADARHAVSNDGSRVFFTSGHLYMRDLARAETVRLDAVQSGPGGGEIAPGGFQIASSDGSRVFFTDKQALTSNSGTGPGPGDLYECEIVEVAGKLACKLSDLTPLSSGEFAGVQGGVLGASEDGSWVYFVADGVLAPGAVPRTGLCDSNSPSGMTCNLYVRHGGTTRLVAVLSAKDSPSWQESLTQLTARVSPDGRWLAFMSQRSLTGYDNRDALSGKPDEEVYLYNAETEQLACASCNPTGARPLGVEYGGSGHNMPLLSDNGTVWESSTSLAADLPGWTPYRGGVARYQSRYLSDTGRLFFNSHDALVSKDVNATWDVYQYEPEGAGPEGAQCRPQVSGGSAVFKPARTFEAEGHKGEEPAGCVGLISSGGSTEESAFLDASESGGDVFFLTTSKLAPQDFDNAYDVYDAHECTASAPCLPPPAEQFPPCNAGDSCKAAPTPQPSIFGAPPSATFAGAGNVAPPAALKKSLTRVQKLAKVLKACKTKRDKHKRGVCERQARRAYGAAYRANKSRRRSK
jgi:hypothetical protein